MIHDSRSIQSVINYRKMTGENSNVKEKPMWGLKQALPQGYSKKKEASDLANLLKRAKAQVRRVQKRSFTIKSGIKTSESYSSFPKANR